MDRSVPHLEYIYMSKTYPNESRYGFGSIETFDIYHVIPWWRITPDFLKLGVL